MSEIEEQLKEMEARRKLLKEQLSKSQATLNAVDEKITDFKRRQEARLTTDDRVDNAVVDQLADRS